MNIFGIDFTAAELVLLILLLGVIICLFVVLGRLRPAQRQSEESWEDVGAPVASAEDVELVAVLTAAAAAYMGVEPANIQLQSYQPVENKLRRSRWSQAGRTEQFSRG